MTECEKQVAWKWGEVRVSTTVIEVTAGPAADPHRGKAIVVLATPLSPQDVYFIFTCLQGNQVPNVRYHLQNTGKCSSLPSEVTPQALLRLSLFSGNRLARPLIVIHPSCAPVYKREIRISITRAQRQRDWWVSHRIPSVSYPSLCFRSEKWTLSSAMIRFSLHISIQESVLSGWYTIPTRRQPAEGLWKSNIIRLFGLFDLLFTEWAGDTFDVTV